MSGAGDKDKDKDKGKNEDISDIIYYFQPLLQEINARLSLQSVNDISQLSVDDFVKMSLKARDMYAYLIFVYDLSDGSKFIKDEELLKIYRELQKNYKSLDKDIGMYKAVFDTFALAVGKIIVDKMGKNRAYEIFKETGIVQEKYYERIDVIAKPNFVLSRCMARLQNFPEFFFSSCTFLFTLLLFILFMTQCAHLSRFYNLAKTGMFVDAMKSELEEKFAYINTVLCTLQNDAFHFLSELKVNENTSTDDLLTGLNYCVILHAITHFKFNEVIQEMYSIFEHITPDVHALESSTLTPEAVREKLISRLTRLESISIYLQT